jgi:hypothetical protein
LCNNICFDFEILYKADETKLFIASGGVSRAAELPPSPIFSKKIQPPPLMRKRSSRAAAVRVKNYRKFQPPPRVEKN